MTTIHTFEEIEAWKNARLLTDQIYKITKRGDFARDFGLKNQIRRAVISIMSNIAEGYDSYSLGTFKRYLDIARSSAGEVRSQLYIALDQSYVSRAEFDALCDLSGKISAQIGKFRGYLTMKTRYKQQQ